MTDRQLVAGLIAVAAAGLIAALFWRRAAPAAIPDSRYPLLELTMRAAMALAVGALTGWLVFLLAASGG